MTKIHAVVAALLCAALAATAQAQRLDSRPGRFEIRSTATDALVVFGGIYIPSSASVGPPTFGTRSAGTRITLYPVGGSNASDFAIGIDSATRWDSVPTDTNLFKWFHGATETLRLSYHGVSYTLPSLDLAAVASSFGARISIGAAASAAAPATLQSGEPGVSANAVVVSNNYRATSTGGSARINTAVGGSFVRLSTNGDITFARISAAGAVAHSWVMDAAAHLLPGAANTQDIGSPSVRVRDVHVGRWLYVGHNGNVTPAAGDCNQLVESGRMTMVEDDDAVYFCYVNNTSGTWFKTPLTFVSTTPTVP